MVLWTMSFNFPVMALDALDINKDGLLEVIALTLHGVYVLIPDFKAAFEKLQRLKKRLSK